MSASTLVIKSWAVNANPPVGQPHIRIVARAGGLMSAILSLLGVDATTTFTVTTRDVEYERGSLAGFSRTITPLEHVSSTYYGQFKPWKATLVIMLVGLYFGYSLMGHGTGSTVTGTIVALGAIAIAAVYYTLQKSLTFGYREHGVKTTDPFILKRSVIEGQEINEESLKAMITVIENLIKPTGAVAPTFVAGGRPALDRLAEPAPTSMKTVIAPASPTACPACKAPVAVGEVFCGNCGHRLK